MGGGAGWRGSWGEKGTSIMLSKIKIKKMECTDDGERMVTKSNKSISWISIFYHSQIIINLYHLASTAYSSTSPVANRLLMHRGSKIPKARTSPSHYEPIHVYLAASAPIPKRTEMSFF